MNYPVSLYVHIPFCVRKCPYCSFAVTAGQEHRAREYIDALERESSGYCAKVAAIYIGGGTPSCLSADEIGRLFAVIRARFQVSDGAEVSFEVNPESVDRNKARLLKKLGVNRVSMGVQSLDTGALSMLGRTHSPQDAAQAFDILRTEGFANINLDMIYGFPGQLAEKVIADLDRFLMLKSEHLSLYALNIEERSLFFARRIEVDNDAQGEVYSEICRRAKESGMWQYEVSNFARTGFESRHNINYWQGGDYIGLGMSAHSHMNDERFWNVDTLPKYLEMISSEGSARAGAERLSSPEKLIEEFLFGLRMNKGVDMERLEKKFGIEMPASKKEALESFIEMDLLEEDGVFIRATTRGRLLLDEISARII